MIRKLSVLALAALLLGACGHQPIYNVNSHPIPQAAQRMSPDQVEKVIVEAGQARGWRFQTVAPGTLRATQDQTKYGAEVEIRYDQKSFTILHVSTRGMKEQGDVVHPHYNFWVRNLESDIDTRLANAAILTR